MNKYRQFNIQIVIWASIFAINLAGLLFDIRSVITFGMWTKILVMVLAVVFFIVMILQLKRELIKRDNK